MWLLTDTCIDGACSAVLCCAVQAAPMSILDVPISYLDKRIGACFGSSEEVQRFREHIFREVGGEEGN